MNRADNRFYRQAERSDCHVFHASETDPAGVRVEVTIVVPLPVADTWKDFREAAEHAQMTASRAMSQIRQSQSMERPPF